MFFSKSKYVQVWSCIKGAWLNEYHPEAARELDENELARIRNGNLVGDLARGLFGDSVNVTVRKEDDSLDLSQMIENTRLEMEKGTEVICEASFSYEGLYCAVDLLRREGAGWAIYEVKSTTGVEDKHIADVSYQLYVLRHCGIKVTGVNLVCIDREYVLGEEGLDLKGYFKIVDLKEQAEAEQGTVPELLATAERVLSSEQEPAQELGDTCHKCAFFRYCIRSLSSPHIFDLHGMQMRTKLKHYRNGIVSFLDLEKSGVVKNDFQKLQIDHELHDRETYVNVGKVREFLADLSYPLYFLDFETMQTVIPIFIGTHPNAQVPFQYSLHFIEHEGGEVQHREFLAVSGDDPRRKIAESLCENIPANACVTAYHKDFECTRLAELAEAFPDMAEHLRAIRDHIVDLEVPFKNGWYYKREMEGRSSIKNVLPAICPNDPELDYHSLEGVHNGGEAMTIFPKIQHMEPEEQEKARRNLLDYCCLDTLAMVKVWEELKRVAE